MMTVQFSVAIIDDVTFEQSETFKVTIDPISLPYGITLGDNPDTTITIEDDDSKYKYIIYAI